MLQRAIVICECRRGCSTCTNRFTAPMTMSVVVTASRRVWHCIALTFWSNLKLDYSPRLKVHREKQVFDAVRVHECCNTRPRTLLVISRGFALYRRIVDSHVEENSTSFFGPYWLDRPLSSRPSVPRQGGSAGQRQQPSCSVLCFDATAETGSYLDFVQDHNHEGNVGLFL